MTQLYDLKREKLGEAFPIHRLTRSDIGHSPRLHLSATIITASLGPPRIHPYCPDRSNVARYTIKSLNPQCNSPPHPDAMLAEGCFYIWQGYSMHSLRYLINWQWMQHCPTTRKFFTPTSQLMGSGCM